MLARIQPIKTPNSAKLSSDAQREIIMKQSIGEIMGDESWKSEINIPGQALAPLCENSDCQEIRASAGTEIAPIICRKYK